jgi:hypothetical protein
MLKIAIPTSDKKTIAGHTGHAEFFNVITLENEQVVNSEFRKNPHSGHEHHIETESLNVEKTDHDHGGGCGCGNGHGHGHDHGHNHGHDDGGCGCGNGHGHGHDHGHDHSHGGGGCGCGSHGHEEVDEGHLQMAKSIADCEFFVLKQLGGKLATPLQRYDIRPVMIRGEVLVNIDDIVKEFVAFSKANNVPV